VIEVSVGGNEWVVVKREDWTDEQAKEYAVADNSAALNGIKWDSAVLASYNAQAIDLSPYFRTAELTDLPIIEVVHTCPHCGRQWSEPA
jgi:hypothetical protein